MYCSSCGAAVKPDLSYCNHCGAELNSKQRAASLKLSETSLQSLVWAIASVTIVGLGAVIGLMAVMKEVLHFNETLIIAFSLLSFLCFLGVDSVFIWVLIQSRKGAKEGGSLNQHKGFSKREFGETNARALSESGFSVTEHTTRELEEVDRKRKNG